MEIYFVQEEFLANLQQQFDKLQPFLPGEGNLEIHHARQQALTDARLIGLPHPKLAMWKYALLNEFSQLEFKAYIHPCESLKHSFMEPHLINDIEQSSMVFLNGYYVPKLSHKSHDNPQITIAHLSHLAKVQPDLLEQIFENQKNSKQFFNLVNTAMTTDGALIIIPDNVQMEHPIIIYQFLINPTDHATMANTQTHLYVGKKSSAIIIEKVITLGEKPVWLNTHTFINAKDDAHVSYFRHVIESPLAYHFHQLHTAQTSGRLELMDISMGAGYHRIESNHLINQPHAKTTLNGLMLPERGAHIDWNSNLHHIAPECQSHVNVKSLIGAGGHSSFFGKIFVNKNAQKTNTRMDNHHLHLFNSGRADSAPGFEIMADDVQCTHGATVGQLDEQVLFYCESRGIDKEIARQLLIDAFIEDILHAIRPPPIHEYFRQTLYDQIATLLKGGPDEH